MENNFKNIVFEGGGVKGIAYVGALQALEEYDVLFNIKRVGGASAGAINALLLALDYTLTEIKDTMWSLDFNNFMDDEWGIIRDTNRLVNQFGWYKGEFFLDWIGDIIEKKTGKRFITFKDFSQWGTKDLYIVGTNLSKNCSEIFSSENTPDMSIMEAIRISMSIPLFFSAVRRETNGDVYVDGGIFNNYPVKMFDKKKYLLGENHFYQMSPYMRNGEESIINKETIGFRLDSKQEIKTFLEKDKLKYTKIDDFFDYIKALLKAIMSVQDNQHLNSNEWLRTVYINTIGVNTVDFDIDDITKKALIDEGYKGTINFLERTKFEDELVELEDIEYNTDATDPDFNG